MDQGTPRQHRRRRPSGSGVTEVRQQSPASGIQYPQQAVPQQPKRQTRQKVQPTGAAYPRTGARQAGYRQAVPQQNNRRQAPRQTWASQPVTQGWQPPLKQARIQQTVRPAAVQRQKTVPARPLGKVLAVIVALAALVVAVVVGVNAIRGYQTQQVVSSYENTFVPGVHVDGIDLSGMTAEEGARAVQTQAQNRSRSWSVQLTSQGQLVTTITADQLGMTVDITDAMQQAWAIGHTGTQEERKRAIEALQQQPYEGYTTNPNGQTTILDDVLEQIQTKIYQPAQDARLLGFDPNASYPFTFQNEVYGRFLNTAPLKEQLYRMVSTMESGTVEITPETIIPNVTVDQLKAQYSLRSSVSTPISSRSSESRTNNIRRSFEKLNGYVWEPGKKFSFNNVVGKRTVANGFSEAVEYAYGNEVMGIGGGVCQASTTVYQAAVMAGLEIIHREPHSDSVSYTPYGQDATVYWEGKRQIDLVLRNNTDAPIYLVAAVESDPANARRLVARVSMYGASMDNVRYELKSETVKVLDPPTEPKYIKDKQGRYNLTYVDDEKVIRKAKEGYVVESYRLKYENGELVDTTTLFSDRYEPKQEIIYTGTKKRGS